MLPLADKAALNGFAAAYSVLEAAAMSASMAALPGLFRLSILLEQFSTIDDPRDIRPIIHALAEILLLVLYGIISDYSGIAVRGEAHLDVLQSDAPYTHRLPAGRCLTIPMNRIDSALFRAAFTGWGRDAWPKLPEFVAMEGKGSRRSHRCATGEPSLHPVSAFATRALLALAQ